MALPVVDFRTFTVDDIRECLGNNGFITTDAEFEIAQDGAFKYIGNSVNGNHRYLVGFVDDVYSSTDEEQYYVSRVLVKFDPHKSVFVAEYTGVPECMGNREHIDEYIAQKCN